MSQNDNITDVDDMNENDDGDDARKRAETREQENPDDIGDAGGDEDGDTVHDGEIVSAEETDRALAVNGGNAASLYAAYEPEEAEALRQAIREAKEIILGSAVETGRALLRVKSLVKHGKFEDLVALEFPMVSKRTAQNLMSMATAVDTALGLFDVDGERKLLTYPQTVLYQVGDRLVPEDAKADIVDGMVHDRYESDDEILEAVRDAKERAKAERRSGKGDGEEEGNDEEAVTESAADRNKRIKEARRRFSAYTLTRGLLAMEEDGGAMIEPDEILSHYGDIGTGPKRKVTAEDHTLVSETLLSLAQAHKRGGFAAVEKLKPIVPEEIPSKVKAKAKKDGGDD